MNDPYRAKMARIDRWNRIGNAILLADAVALVAWFVWMVTR